MRAAIQTKTIIKAAIAAVIIVVLYGVNMIYFSMKPSHFVLSASPTRPSGWIFVDTISRLIKQELSGPGGWQPNDIPPSPGWLLDNRSNLQLGILEVVRCSTIVVRDSLARQHPDDAVDPDCDSAMNYFSGDPHSWIMPSAEKKYRRGAAALDHYAANLKQGSAHFQASGTGLIAVLEHYAHVLDRVNTGLLNASRSGLRSSSKDIPGFEPIAWRHIDDTFYHAQGVGYGMYHIFQAIAVDFKDVLQPRNGDTIVREIITSFEQSYFEPLIVTNGSPSGIFANHCSNLLVSLDDARQKINSLIAVLASK